ncbi:MAG: pseudaminic acid synthase [Bacteroidia bacterium]
MKIADFKIGQRVLIIAELSANHGQQLKTAVDTVRAVKAAGADAIKFQTYRADTITINSVKDYFKIKGGLWDGRNLYDLYEEAHTPWEWHKELFEISKEEGLICFSSPFDKTAVDFLEELNTAAYKIASFEIQDIPLIAYAASKGKPMIMSTGIATEEDIELAISTCRQAGNNEIIILKCTSAYPAPIELANLKTMVDMRDRFNVEVGLSDHTFGHTVPVVATALGARVIEKHFILDKTIGGPDAAFSLDPTEFSALVEAVRNAEKALGEVTYEIPEKVESNRKFARSLFVVKDMERGEVFTSENVRSIRPGYGLHPKYYDQVLGKQAKIDLNRGTPLLKNHVDGIQ